MGFAVEHDVKRYCIDGIRVSVFNDHAVLERGGVTKTVVFRRNPTSVDFAGEWIPTDSVLASVLSVISDFGGSSASVVNEKSKVLKWKRLDEMTFSDFDGRFNVSDGVHSLYVNAVQQSGFKDSGMPVGGRTTWSLVSPSKKYSIEPDEVLSRIIISGLQNESDKTFIQFSNVQRIEYHKDSIVFRLGFGDERVITVA